MNNHTGVIRLDNKESFIEYSVEMLKTAIRQVYILSPDFDREWLGDATFVEQLKLSIVKNRRVQVRLLVANPTSGIRNQHPLIGLIRRLSRFEAKVITEEFLDKQPLKETRLLVDLGGVVLRQSASDFIGFAHFNDKQNVQNLLEDFEQYWRFSVAHSDLRHVYL